MSFSSRASQWQDTGWRPPTTMVDILFLLLTFFITIAAFRDEYREIDVKLQEAAADGKARARAPIIITVTAGGDLFLGQQKHTADSLRATLKILAKELGNEPVLVRGDQTSRLGMTVQILDMARAAGLTRVSVATAKPGE